MWPFVCGWVGESVTLHLVDKIETTVYVSPATHRNHFVRRLPVRLSHFPKLCFAGDTCIPRNAATFFTQSLSYFTCKLWMVRGGTLFRLLNLGHEVKVKFCALPLKSVYKTLWA